MWDTMFKGKKFTFIQLGYKTEFGRLLKDCVQIKLNFKLIKMVHERRDEGTPACLDLYENTKDCKKQMFTKVDISFVIFYSFL